METMEQIETGVPSAAQREIPVPPGGGSWFFNESSWQWESNDPLPAQAAADVAANATEQEP